MNVADKTENILSAMDHLESQWDSKNDEEILDLMQSEFKSKKYRFQYFSYAAVIVLLILSNVFFVFNGMEESGNAPYETEDMASFLMLRGGDSYYDF